MPNKGKKLSEKQELFCIEYLVDMNATQSYKRAGYSVHSDMAAGVEGHKLLKNPKIQARIAELMKERSKRTEITTDRVLKELATLAFSKFTDFGRVIDRAEEVEKEDPESEDDGEDDDSGLPKVTETKYFRGVEIFETDKIDPALIPAIASIKQTNSGIELKLHDKTKSLELVMRHLGMLNDKLIVNADEELKNLYKTVMNRRVNK